MLEDDFSIEEAVTGMSNEELSEVLAEEGVELDSHAAAALKGLIAQFGSLEGAIEALAALDLRKAG